jgi:predicted component of type VI protein secretion system
MEVKLVVEKGQTRTRVVRLSTLDTLVGRQRGCDMRIPSAEVSRRHCLLRVEEGYLTVEDLKSANGTFVNGAPVDGRMVVRPGDHLEIGPLTFVVEYELTQAAIDRLAQLEGGYEEVIHEAEDDIIDVVEVPDANQADEGVIEVLDDDGVLSPGAPPGVVKEQPAPADQFELGDADQWQLPPPEELRDILSQLDGPRDPP